MGKALAANRKEQFLRSNNLGHLACIDYDVTHRETTNEDRGRDDP